LFFYLFSLVRAQKIKQSLEGHTARVGVVAWYANNLSSGKKIKK